MNYNEITSAIIGASIAIHRKFGPGLLESVYETLLAYELRKLGFKCVCQRQIPLIHETLTIPDAFKADLIVNECVLVELKSVDKINNSHFKQTLTYLRLTGFKFGLLINFNEPLLKDGIHRVANERTSSS